MERFSKDGKIVFPLFHGKKTTKRRKKQQDRHVVTEAYCPKGCNIINEKYIINDAPGLWLKFRRPGMEGEFVLSAVKGDISKILLSGKLDNDTKNELYCPHCDTGFKKLINCSCQPNAEMIVIGLTPKLNYNNAISFCNVAGCTSHTFVRSADVLLSPIASLANLCG
jgi:hypothetical protein